MIWQGWLFLGAVAFIATYLAITTTQDDVLILFGLIGLLSWGLFGFQSLHVVVSSGGQATAETYTYAPMTIWALAMAVTNGYAVLNGPIAIVDQRQRAQQEIQK